MVGHFGIQAKKSHFREPLYKGPPGSPDLDPGIERDLARIRKEKSEYLPPLRYDKDEEIDNIYLSSDEAYSTTAKLLSYEYSCCKHTYNAHHVLKKNLTPTQRKFFSEAHMERERNISNGTIASVPSTMKLVKQIDSVFGMVLLEYYASKDGKLTAAQEDSIEHALRKERKSQERSNLRVNRDEEIELTGIALDKGNEGTIPETPVASNTSVATTVTETNGNGKDDEPYNDQFESSFDRLYHNISSKDQTEVLPVESSTTENTLPSEATATQTSRTKLRQELLREIMQVTKLLRKETDTEQKLKYEHHLNNLRCKFNQHIEGTPVKSSNMTIVFESQNKVDTNWKPVHELTDEPIETIEKSSEHLVMDFETDPGSVFTETGNSTVACRELKFINIVAPRSMPEGYLFDAMYRNEKFLAKVPRGGVDKGEVFTTPMLNPSGASNQYVSYELGMKSMHVPRGGWRDGFCNCFKDPLCFLSFVFPHVALSQIQSRMKLVSGGRIVSPFGTRFLIFFVLALISLNAWTAVALIFLVNKPQLWLILSCTIPLGLLDLFVFCTFIAKTIKTRKVIRECYDIEEQACHGSEDTILGIFCSCCSISQMGRHTADYETYRESFLSPTGLPRQLEMIVPIHTYSMNNVNIERSVHSF